jgi:Breast carcinoma amplified sequence 2 (BCAS2)
MDIMGQDDRIGSSEEQQQQHEAMMVLDALPYIDPVAPYYEQYALALIEDEMKLRPVSRQADITAVNFRTETMQEAYEHCATTTRAAGTNAALQLFPVAPPDNENDDMEAAWRDAVNKARIAYEWERLRGIQLEVDKQEDNNGTTPTASLAAVWKQYNHVVLEQQHAALQQQLTAQLLAVEEINFNRQQDQQERCGRQLQVLSSQYDELVQKQFQLKHAIAGLEEEILAQRRTR